MAALGDGVPDQDVAVESMHGAAFGRVGFGDPIVVIGGAHFVGIAIGESPSDTDNKDSGILLQDGGFALFAGEIGIEIEDLFGVQESELLGEVGIARVLELGEQFLDVLFGAGEDLPDAIDDQLEEVEVALVGSDGALPIPLIDVGAVVVVEEIILADGAHIGAEAFALQLEEVEVALVGSDGALPIPLIDVGAVVVVEEIILADGAHIGAEAFALLHAEALEGDAFPLGGGLNHLGVDGVHVAVVRNVELDGGAGAIAVEIIVHTAIDIDDQRDGDHHEVELLAEVSLDIILGGEDSLLGVLGVQQGGIIPRKDFLEFGVIANAGSSQVRFFVGQGIHIKTSGHTIADGIGVRRCATNCLHPQQ